MRERGEKDIWTFESYCRNYSASSLRSSRRHDTDEKRDEDEVMHVSKRIGFLSLFELQTLYGSTTLEYDVRGLDLDDSNYDVISSYCSAFQRLVDRHIIPMLERWSDATLRDGNNPQICIVSAHLALLFQNFEYEHLDTRTVALHICSHVNLMSRHSFLSDPMKRERGKVSAQQSKAVVT